MDHEIILASKKPSFMILIKSITKFTGAGSVFYSNKIFADLALATSLFTEKMATVFAGFCIEAIKISHKRAELSMEFPTREIEKALQ